MNNDTYVECLVKRKNTAQGMLLRGAMIGLTVFCVLAMLFNMVFLILAVVFGALTYYAFGCTNVEYEYLYLDREITVDKIMGQSRRKRVATFQIDKMEIMAPYNSHQLDSYKNRNLKVEDYSSREVEQPDLRFMMVYNDEGNTKLVVLEANDAMVKAIKTIAPRKVFND